MPPVHERAPIREVLPDSLRDAVECSLPDALFAAEIKAPMVMRVRHVVGEVGRQYVWTNPPPQRGYVESLYAALLLDGLFDSGVLDPRVLRVVLGALASGIRA